MYHRTFLSLDETLADINNISEGESESEENISEMSGDGEISFLDKEIPEIVKSDSESRLSQIFHYSEKRRHFIGIVSNFLVNNS